MNIRYKSKFIYVIVKVLIEKLCLTSFITWPTELYAKILSS